MVAVMVSLIAGALLAPAVFRRQRRRAGLQAGALPRPWHRRLLAVTGLSMVDHVLGAGFGLLRGLLFAIAIILGVMAFSRGDKPPEAIVNSRMAPYIVDAARTVVSMAPHDLKEGFRRTYAQVKTAWSEALEKGIHKLPNGGAEK